MRPRQDAGPCPSFRRETKPRLFAPGCGGQPPLIIGLLHSAGSPAGHPAKQWTLPNIPDGIFAGYACCARIAVLSWLLRGRLRRAHHRRRPNAVRQTTRPALNLKLAKLKGRFRRLSPRSFGGREPPQSPQGCARRRLRGDSLRKRPKGRHPHQRFGHNVYYVKYSVG